MDLEVDVKSLTLGNTDGDISFGVNRETRIMFPMSTCVSSYKSGEDRLDGYKYVRTQMILVQHGQQVWLQEGETHVIRSDMLV